MSTDDSRPNCAVDPLDLEGEFARLPGEYARWGYKHAEAREVHLRSKQALSETHAHIRLETQEYLKQQGGRVTEGAIEAEMDVNAEYIAAKVEVINADGAVLRLRAVLDALQIKKEMLISLGATMRNERTMAGV